MRFFQSTVSGSEQRNLQIAKSELANLAEDDPARGEVEARIAKHTGTLEELRKQKASVHTDPRYQRDVEDMGKKLAKRKWKVAKERRNIEQRMRRRVQNKVWLLKNGGSNTLRAAREKNTTAMEAALMETVRTCSLI